MISIFFRNDRYCPQLVCDVCERPILKAGLAVAVMPHGPRGQRERLPVLHAHKGRCHELVESRLGGKDKTGWEELQKHLLYVVSNAGITAEQFCELDEQDRWVLEP